MFTSTFSISCREGSLVCQHNPTTLAVYVKILNLWLHSVLFKREVSFTGPMQGLLMILVLWCYVKHDVREAWQECWGGRSVWCKATSSPHHKPPELLPVPRWKFMVSAGCKLSCFAYYLSTPGHSAIDHRFVQWFATGWTVQVKIRVDRADPGCILSVRCKFREVAVLWLKKVSGDVDELRRSI